MDDKGKYVPKSLHRMSHVYEVLLFPHYAGNT